MESIASKLKTRRESLNILLEQISNDTHISIHHLRSLESGHYEDLPGGMYNRAILGAYCDELGLDRNEILSCYDSEVTPYREKPAAAVHHFPWSLNIGAYTAAVWVLIVFFGIGIFLNREWFISALSPYFSYDYAGAQDNLPVETPLAPANTVGVGTAEDSAADARISDVYEEIPPAVSPAAYYDGDNNKADELLPEQTTQPAPAADDAAQQQLQLEIIGKEECWLSVDRDETGVVTKILTPGEVESYTATRTISLVVGNAGGVALRINDRAAKTLGQSGQVVRLTIDKYTLQNLIDPSAS